MPVGLGSPDATPRVNGLSAKLACPNAGRLAIPAIVMPAAKEPPVLRSVRRVMRWSQSPVMPTTYSLLSEKGTRRVSGRRAACDSPQGMKTVTPGRGGQNGPMRKIDAFAHILPPGYLEHLERHLASTMRPDRLRYYREGVFRFDPVMSDLDARFRVMDRHGDY